MAFDDATLVGKALAGDSSAFGKLYDRYAGLIRAICCDATGDVAQAQDLAQEAFLRAHGKLAGLRDPAKFGSWLIDISRRVCSEWRRSRARDKHTFVARVPEPATRAANNGRAEHLRELIQLLPDRDRLALHAFYLQEQSAERARAVLGLSRSGLYRALERAREKLARLLRAEEKEEMP